LLPGSGWALLGNAGTDPLVNFAGTSDAQDFVLKANGTEQLRLLATNGINIPAQPIGVQTGVGIVYKGGDRYLHSSGGVGCFFSGRLAGNLTLTGADNTGVGESALVALTSGVSNTAVGSAALQSQTTGDNNVAVGQFAMRLNAFGGTGSDNVAVGCEALVVAGSGLRNTAVGRQAGSSLITGTDNTLIGYSAGTNSSANVNATALGAYALAASDNVLILGSILGVNGAAANTFVGIGTSAPATKLELKNGALSLTNDATASEIRFYEPSASGANYSSFKAQAQTATIDYTLPAAVPAAVATGQLGKGVLETASTGALVWRQTSITPVVLGPQVVALNATAVISVAVTGAQVGDIVSVGLPAALVNSDVVYTWFIAAADTVSVQVRNFNAAAPFNVSGTVNIQLTRP